MPVTARDNPLSQKEGGQRRCRNPISRSMMMTHTFGRQSQDARELSHDELDHVSGGMKWTPGTKNPDVIDTRGGQLETWFGTFTFDVKGKVSSYNPPS
jgi:hypothetical protein